jgi:predicted sugar kinase
MAKDLTRGTITFYLKKKRRGVIMTLSGLTIYFTKEGQKILDGGVFREPMEKEKQPKPGPNSPVVIKSYERDDKAFRATEWAIVCL